MKCYGAHKRTMLKLSKNTTSIFNNLASQSQMKLNEPLETNTNTFSIGFNKPENPGIEVEIAAHLTGSHYNETKGYLAQYEGIYNPDAAPEAIKMLPADNQITAEYYITAPYNCEKHIEVLKDGWNELMTAVKFGTDSIKPRFTHQDGLLTIGLQGPLPIPGFNDVKIPYNLQQVLSEVDQHFKINFAVGASYKDVLESKEPMLKHLSKGFQLKI